MKQSFEKQNRIEKKVVELEKDMISLARVVIDGLELLQGELVRQGRHIRNLTTRIKKLELSLGHIDYHVAIKCLGSMFQMLLSALNRYLMLYETILYDMDQFLDALDNLYNNQLSCSVIPPDVMNTFIQHVKQTLGKRFTWTKNNLYTVFIIIFCSFVNNCF